MMFKKAGIIAVTAVLVLVSPGLSGYEAVAQTIRMNTTGRSGPRNVPALSMHVGAATKLSISLTGKTGLTSRLPGGAHSPTVALLEYSPALGIHSLAIPSAPLGSDSNVLSPAVRPIRISGPPITANSGKASPHTIIAPLKAPLRAVNEIRAGRNKPGVVLQELFEGRKTGNDVVHPGAVSYGDVDKGKKLAHQEGVKAGAGAPLISLTPADDVVGPHGPQSPEAAKIPKKKGIGGLLTAQALTILNDSALKTLIAVWVTATMPLAQAAFYISLGTGLYVLPFLLFSVWSGKFADRTNKAKLIVWLKVAEVGFVGLAGAALFFANIPALLSVLFLMGIHSAMLTPAKYSLLAERVPSKALPRANGLLEMTASFAMMMGTAAGGLLYYLFSGTLTYSALPLLVIAGIGVLASLKILPGRKPAPPKSDDSEPIAGGFKMPRHLFGAALALTVFWFIASMIQMNIFIFGEHVLHVGEAMITGLLTVTGVTMGIGSYLAGLFSKAKAERGFVPLAAIGVLIPLLSLGLFGASVPLAFLMLGILGLSAGFYFVPLNTYLQNNSPDEVRGRNLGVSSFLGYTSVLFSAAIFYGLNNWLHVDPQTIFLVTAGTTSIAITPVVWKLWSHTMRFLRSLFGSREDGSKK